MMRLVRCGLVTLSLFVGAAACADDPGAAPELVGNVQLTVTNGPSNVRCLRVIASTELFEVVRNLGVSPGQSTVFNLNGIPTGLVTFQGVAFNTACSSVTATTNITWASAPVEVQVLRSQPANVQLELYRATNVGISADFRDELADGQACTSNVQCSSGACNTFFRDADGDGFGVAETSSFCGTTAPAGYSAQSGDCYDSHANARPGQTQSFSVHRGDMSFDYDCSGSVQVTPATRSAGCVAGTTFPTCASATVTHTAADCGRVQAGCGCAGTSLGTCTTGCGGAFTITCR